MMETAPTTSFVVTQPEFLLQFLVISLDDPAMLAHVNEFHQGGAGGKSGEPILGWFRFRGRPLDQQPFFRAWLGQLGVAMCRSHPLPCEARSEPVGAALAPRNGLPCCCRQAESEGFYRQRLMLPVAPQQLGWSSTTSAMLRWQRSRPWRPDRGVGTDTRYIAQAKSGDVRSQPSRPLQLI